MYYCIHCRTKTNPVPKSQVVCKTRKGREYLQEICSICTKKKSVFVTAAVLSGIPSLEADTPIKKVRKTKASLKA